jgi:hypothetical protein
MSIKNIPLNGLNKILNMLKDKIINIVKTLTHLTTVGVLKWDEDTPLSKNRGYKRKMISHGEDGSIYEMEIKFSLKEDRWELESSPDLWIKNKSLPDGMFYITTYRSEDEVKNLRDAIIETCCQDMKPSIKDIEDTLDDIAKGISIVEFREGRLNKILNQ